MIKRTSGFSLLEMVIVVAIVGILCAISLPLYSTHLVHARRLEAEVDLIKLASALEKYHVLNNTYQDATLNKLNFSEHIANHAYLLRIVSATPTDYVLTATPQDAQAQKDLACATLTLDSTGQKKISGDGQLNECWQ